MSFSCERTDFCQNRTKKHPLHCEMDTSRVDGVKAPQRRGTPRSYLEVKGLHRLGDAVVGRRRDAVAADALEEAHFSVSRARGSLVDGRRPVRASTAQACWQPTLGLPVERPSGRRRGRRRRYGIGRLRAQPPIRPHRFRATKGCCRRDQHHARAASSVFWRDRLPFSRVRRPKSPRRHFGHYSARRAGVRHTRQCGLVCQAYRPLARIS